MEANLVECDPAVSGGGVCVCKGGPTLSILKDVQRAYEERIELVNKVGGKNKLQKELELLRSWVGDLVEQNGLLVRAVEEMESEISSRVMLERRRNSEIESELRAEVMTLRRRLSRKDSDVRGLLELLRRLRDYDHRDIHDIRFYEPDQKRTTNEEVHELKVLNDTLQKENYTKERELRKLSTEVQQREQMIATLKNEMTICRSIPTKDKEVMTDLENPITQREEIVPVQDCNGSWKEPAKQQERLQQLDLKLKTSTESMRTMRKENVELKEELRAMSHLCGALYEQRHAAALRLQFKDEIIREMRRQLRQAKAKLETAKCLKSVQKTLSAEREDGTNAGIPYGNMLPCVRQQPRRKSRLDIEWESQSPDVSPDDTESIKID